MKALTIAKSLRWTNLLMMVAALALVRYCIFLPVYRNLGIPLQTSLAEFLLLAASTLFIGAGGYLVNDILDAGLDNLNKPGKNLVGKVISEKAAWNLYYALTFSGVACGALLSWLAGKYELGLLFLVIATSLYYYSLKYKYLPFWGNLTVALLTAVNLFIVWLFEFFILKKTPENFIQVSTYFGFLNRFVFGYAFFAFFTTLIREIIKDTQDREGDARFGCLTIPIVLGWKKTRVLLASLLGLLLAAVILVQLHLSGSFLLLALSLSIVDILIILILTLLFREKPDFGKLSLLMKAVMAAGLLSMIFLWYPK